MKFDGSIVEGRACGRNPKIGKGNARWYVAASRLESWIRRVNPPTRMEERCAIEKLGIMNRGRTDVEFDACVAKS